MARIPLLKIAAAVALLVASLVGTQPAYALCKVCSPAAPVPADRYEPEGNLAPASILGDLTWYKEDFEPGCAETNWFDLDIEAGWMFTATGNAVEIWDVRNAVAPERAKIMCRPAIGLFKKSDQDFYHLHVDAPPGNPDVVAVGVDGGMGLLVLNTADKNSPYIAYQDEGETTIGALQNGRPYNTNDLYVARIGKTAYAFVATSIQSRIAVYNLTKAATKDNCLASAGSCGSGVYLGTFGEHKTDSLAGADKYVAMRTTTTVQVFDATNPVAPVLVAEGGPSGPKTVEMWKQGSGYRVAASTGNSVEIYDLVCANGSCRLVLWDSVPVQTATLLTASQDGGNYYLFVGIPAGYGRIGGSQLEYLLDVSGTQAEDLTPQAHQDGYWGWYYEGNDTGFRRVSPYTAQMHDGHLFRAALSLLDSHERRGVSAPPVSDFSWSPSTIYPGTPVTFTDKSNGRPNAWFWSFDNADVSTSSTQNPAGIEFLDHGPQNVSLTAENEFGAGNQETKSLTVLDPAPSFTAISASPATAPICSTVNLSASGAKGQPPLTWNWEVKDDQEQVIAAGSTADGFDWEVDQNLPTGAYTAHLTLSNDSGNTTKSTPVTIQSLDTLGFGTDGQVPAEQYAPTLVGEDLGLADFTMAAKGATRWTWDFGDGQCPTGFTKSSGACTTTNPALGQAPSHQYTEGDTSYDVTVTIENCRDGSLTSAVLAIDVGPVQQLVPRFSADGICAGGILGCAAFIGQEITFTDHTTGFPQGYEVDWKGDGNFVAETPVGGKFTHTYVEASANTGYRPVLRATRGSQVKTFTHQAIVVTSSAGPPGVTVGRSSATPLVDAAVTFTATPRNCTANSWTWAVGAGGTISGSATASGISVRYASAGNRTITATAVGGSCGGASGTTTVNVRAANNGGGNNGGGNGGGNNGGGNSKIPTARFTFSPANPAVGQEVSFDASTSSGATGYQWNFDDGSSATGEKVTHTFTSAGSFSVKVEASRADPTCSFGLCVGATRNTVVVGGEPPPPPPPLVTNGCEGTLADDPGTLCLLDGRFQVQVDWTNQHNGNDQGIGQGNLYTGSKRTGLFWFFNPDNVELIVKMIDASEVDGNIWFFYGALSDVEYTIRVLDTATGIEKSYSNQAGAICGLGDTGAFQAAIPPSSSGASLPPTSALGSPFLTGSLSSAWGASHSPFHDDEEDEETEEPADGALELLDGRFEVTVDFNNQYADDAPGVGTPVVGTNKSGYFWFFRPDNLELVVKMIDARELSGSFWVFWGGLSDVKYNIHIHDHETGLEWTYSNPAGSICGGADLDAFIDIPL